MLNSNLNGAICRKFAKSTLFLAFVLFCAPSFAQQKGSKRSYVDTFKLADKFVAKKKFRKAANLYSAYQKNHPKDVNAAWKLAQMKLWLHNNKQAYKSYNEALKLNPKDDNLNLDYIHSLLDMGKLGEAGSRLTDMELAGKDYPNMSLLRAKLNYYRGDYKQAAAYIRKDLNAEPGNAESQELNDLIEMARSPLVSLQTSYLTDNQPLKALISTIKAENYFNRYATLYVIFDEYHFMQNRVSDAPWLRVGNKLFFPDAGLHMNMGAGIVKFPVNDKIGWSANLALNKKISAQFDGDLSLDHVPYMDTRTSLDTNISATRVAAMLNWHLRNWSAQAAFLNSTYENGNNVYGAYAWVMAPIVQFSTGKLLAGYSASYSNSSENAFKPVLGINEIIAGYGTNPNVAGLFNPYFTPQDLFITSALVSLHLNPSKMVSINLGGDIGYGSISNPYLYLDVDNNGNRFIGKGYSTEYFLPATANASFNFHLDKTWLLSARYTYRNTYFFTSHYVSLGVQKSFQHNRKKPVQGGTTGYSALIKEIEGQIQALFNTKTPEELKSSVAKIRRQLVTLRDAQKEKMKTTEHLPDSDEVTTLQERYDNLDEMVRDLDAVDLEDFNSAEGKKDKRQMLIRKQYELSTISYPGNL